MLTKKIPNVTRNLSFGMCQTRGAILRLRYVSAASLLVGISNLNGNESLVSGKAPSLLPQELKASRARPVLKWIVVKNMLEPETTQQSLVEHDYLKQVARKGAAGKRAESGIDLIGFSLDTKLYEAVLSKYLNQPLTEEQITQIEHASYKFFQDQGHPFVVVEMPEQDVTEGILYLKIYESRIDAIHIRGAHWTKEKHILRRLKIQPGDVIDQDALIQKLYLLNQNPLRLVDFVYQRGTQDHTTNLEIVVQEPRWPISLYVGGDNTGVASTGKERYLAGFNWGQAFDFDHSLSFQYTSSTDFKTFQGYTGQYLAPLRWGHILNVYGGYATIETKTSGAIQHNHGESVQASFRYTLPTVFRNHIDFIWGLGYDFKRTNNTLQFSEDLTIFGRNVNLTQAVGTLQTVWQTQVSTVRFMGNVFWSFGPWLPDQSNSDYNSLRPGARNEWIYGTALLGYDQKLGGGFLLSLLGRAQGSSTPLLPSEQIGIGGYDTVRGYDEREFTADSGVIANAALYTPSFPVLGLIWKKIPDSLRFLVFFDYGRGLNIDPIPQTSKDDDLMSVGPGIRYTISSYLQGRLDWGFKLHRSAQLGQDPGLLHFSLIVSY